MTHRSLIEYVQKVYQLERLTEEQQMVSNQLSNILSVPPQIEYESFTEPEPMGKSGLTCGMIFLTIILSIIGAIVGLVIALIKTINGTETSFGSYALRGAIIVAIIMIIITIIAAVFFDSKAEKNEYQKKYNEIQNQNTQKEYQMQKWLNDMQMNLNTINTNLNHSKNILANVYNMNIIYPKYRNLIAISSICEYLESGRCEQLTGPYGAYNLYENELRQNLIIEKLDQVIDNLESIKYNQRLLYQAIQETNNRIQQIQSSLTNISQQMDTVIYNSEIMRYNSEISAQNSEYIKWFTFFQNRNKN